MYVCVCVPTGGPDGDLCLHGQFAVDAVPLAASLPALLLMPPPPPCAVPRASLSPVAGRTRRWFAPPCVKCGVVSCVPCGTFFGHPRPAPQVQTTKYWILMSGHSFLGICYGDYDTYLVALVALVFESRPPGAFVLAVERPKTQMAEAVERQLRGSCNDPFRGRPMSMRRLCCCPMRAQGSSILVI